MVLYSSDFHYGASCERAGYNPSRRLQQCYRQRCISSSYYCAASYVYRFGGV